MAQTLARRVAAGEIAAEEIGIADVDAALYTADLPPLDLMIRTSGEQRLSNFMLWQAAYAELYFTDILWPDFDGRALAAALDAFRLRDRRFGGLRSEEHTSELQSLMRISYAVFCLKKKKKYN